MSAFDKAVIKSFQEKRVYIFVRLLIFMDLVRKQFIKD